MTDTDRDVIPVSSGSVYPLLIEVESDTTVNFAYQQNGVPVIKTIQITNIGIKTLDDIHISIISDPGFMMEYTTHISRIQSGHVMTLHSVDLSLSATFLSAQTERLRGSLTIEAHGEPGLIGRKVIGLDILAFHEWNGLQSLPEILAAFVTPNHPAIEKIHHAAGLLLNEWSSGSSLSGYQTQNRRHVYLMASALYTAVQNCSIVYSHAPASFEQAGQQIRLPGRIMETGIGNCLDLTCLLAGCLEQAGLHPLIIIMEGHAFCGVWLDEESFADPVIDELIVLRKRVELHEICVFESTSLTQDPRIIFDESVRMAEAYLTDESRFRVVIDISRTRTGIHRIYPIPVSVQPEREGDIREDPIHDPVPDPDRIRNCIDHIPLKPTPEIFPNSYESRENRLESWKRHLLDLSNKNSLLNFHESRSNLEILHPDLSSLEKALLDGRSYRILSLPEQDVSRVYPDDAKDHTPEFLRDESRAHRLYTPLPGKSLPDRLLHLNKTARDSINESGAPTLFLALGFLAWYDSSDSDIHLLAPLILIPLEIERRSYQEGFMVRRGDEDARINVTLLHRLKVDYGLSISGLDPLPQNDRGIDVRSILLSFRHQVRDILRWEVLDKAVIGHFSFSKFLMWRDLETYEDSLLLHPLIAGLNNPEKGFFRTKDQFPEPGMLDQICRPSDMYLPLSADSSQQGAVRAAGLGSTFVLYGPPGTGKSQTITNIIAHCLALGKTVLFVSEKKVALDVVHERLKSSCLGQFCLELHSNKSNKREVIRQFSLQAENRDTNAEDRWVQQTERLYLVRSHLNAYVRALHIVQPTGESYYQGISRLAGLHDLPCLPLTLPESSEMNAEALAELRDMVRRITIAGDQCGHPSRNVWNTIRGRPWSVQWKKTVFSLIEDLIQDISCLITLGASLGEMVGLPRDDMSRSHLESISRILSLLHESGSVSPALLIADDSVVRAKKFWSIINTGRQRDTRAEWFASRYHRKILEYDLTPLEQEVGEIQKAGVFRRWILVRRIQETVQPLLATGYTPDIRMIAEDIPRIIDYKRKVIAIKSVRTEAEGIFGTIWRSGNPDWDEVSEILSRTESVMVYARDLTGGDRDRAHDLLSRWAVLLSPDVPNQEHEEYTALFNQFLKAFPSFNAHMDDLVSMILADPDLSFGDPADTNYLQVVLSRLSVWRDHISDLHNWCFWSEVREKAVLKGLSHIVRYYEMNPEGRLPLCDLFDRSYYQSWTEFIRDSSDTLRNFVHADFEDNIEYFRRLDDICMLVCRDEIQALLSARLPSGNSKEEQDELGILSHQIQLQRRHLPIRMFLQKIRTILPKMKPCMLMSPISVAQYLDPSLNQFDLVIFDEASQIPVWDAVGVIARGTQTIIVGDPKQLPPTNMFARVDEEETETGLVELESVLDDCIAAGVPRLHLTWHYRSRHESLIAFSNYHFYQNQLLTFPSPRQVSAVSLRSIGGIFDRGRTRTNRKEAEAVVTEIVRRLVDPITCRDSIGVVTFNASQQDLILALLEKARRDFPGIDEFFSDERQDAVFVKNLENVQGDERDLILFSVGYGPDFSGKISMNFGPLNRDGGERRLNVAITRARKEVVVFSSLRSDQIDLSHTMSQGVKLLKNFIAFAQQGDLAISEACSSGSTSCGSPLEEEIASRLRLLGRSVHLHVGCGGYRIDLAVEDPQEPGRYLLGIECDGANFIQSRTARDRFRLQDEILQGLGWDLHRVWSSDWIDDPDREIERIESAIIRAIFKRNTERSRSPDPLGEEEEEDESQFIVYNPDTRDEEEAPSESGSESDGDIHPYVRYSNPVLFGSKEDFSREDANYAILSVLSDIVKTEGPISKEYAMKKVIHHWGIRRLGPAIVERIESFFEKTGIVVRDEGYAVFLWDRDQDPDRYSGLRVKQVFDPEPRRIEDIPPQEIANAVRNILQQNPRISGDELIRAVVRVFGMTRTGPSGEAVIRSVIEKSNNISRSDDDVQESNERLSY